MIARMGNELEHDNDCKKGNELEPDNDCKNGK